MKPNLLNSWVNLIEPKIGTIPRPAEKPFPFVLCTMGIMNIASTMTTFSGLLCTINFPIPARMIFFQCLIWRNIPTPISMIPVRIIGPSIAVWMICGWNIMIAKSPWPRFPMALYLTKVDLSTSVPPPNPWKRMKIKALEQVEQIKRRFSIYSFSFIFFYLLFEVI